MKRYKGWRPIFGPSITWYDVLEVKQKIAIDDLFLFFGTFQETIFNEKDRLEFDQHYCPKHIIFGYMQIGFKHDGNTEPKWMKYHPHSGGFVYLARESLSWAPKLPGGGLLEYDESLNLTREHYNKSIWEFPFSKRPNLTSHKSSRWRRLSKNSFQLESVYRGQEFVFDQNQEVNRWARRLITQNHNFF